MANLAQLVEPRFVVPVVVGSSPIVRPRLKKAPFKRCFFLCELRFAFEGKPAWDYLACKSARS